MGAKDRSPDLHWAVEEVWKAMMTLPPTNADAWK